MDHVILVDAEDRALGTMEKLRAHEEGRLHRAFSVLLFNSTGESLIQRRAPEKYHSGGLWTNACCSHPLPDESMEDATARGLRNELGIALPLFLAYKFEYRAAVERHLTEHELDYVFIGRFDGIPEPNKREVADWKFIGYDALRNDISAHPESYTPWFRLIVARPGYPDLVHTITHSIS